MDAEKIVYSVLVVSHSKSFNDAVLTILGGAKHSPVRFASCIGEAKRANAERDFDFIIINSPLSDGYGTDFAIDCAGRSNSSVLILASADVYAETYEKVYRFGVFTLQKPTARPLMATALEWMASERERLRREEKRSLAIEEKMEEIRMVDRAKWRLIRELNMEENAAHRYIEKQAMDRCVPKTVVAKEIIKTYTI